MTKNRTQKSQDKTKVVCLQSLVKHAKLIGDLLTRSGIGKKADGLKYATNQNQISQTSVPTNERENTAKIKSRWVEFLYMNNKCK